MADSTYYVVADSGGRILSIVGERAAAEGSAKNKGGRILEVQAENTFEARRKAGEAIESEKAAARKPK